MYQEAKYLPVGDRALLVEFGTIVSMSINQKVHALDNAISHLKVLGVEECVPTYRSLLVYYDPGRTSYGQLVFTLKDLERRLGDFLVGTKRKVVQIPVVYGGEYGIDLEFVARHHDLDEEKVIQLHSGREYLVYMVGFVAGFPYLGEVANEIATPRLKSPRLRVPAGSVAIAEKQTGVYPCECPGGWRIIGRTPLKFFDATKHPPALIQPGETVKFIPIGEEEFERLCRGVQDENL